MYSWLLQLAAIFAKFTGISARGTPDGDPPVRMKKPDHHQCTRVRDPVMQMVKNN
ncbi:hypothetical protein ACLOJK_032192 [Asimina triloba]